MLLIGLENSRSPHQCFFSAFTSDAPPYNTLLPRELAERQFLLKSSRAPARVGASLKLVVGFQAAFGSSTR
jgi:hypothetical protein